MIVAFGTNDIVSGEYGGDGGNNADEVNGYISTILEQTQAADCKTILFNAPPQDYDEEHEAVRTALNDTEKQTAEKYGAEILILRHSFQHLKTQRVRSMADTQMAKVARPCARHS